VRLLLIAVTAVLIVVSIVVLGGFAVLARRLLGLRFGLT
jgi:hypothetical protein